MAPAHTGNANACVAMSAAVPLEWHERLYGAVAPAAFACAWAAGRLGGESAAEMRTRAGFLPAAAPGLIWCHGASAGEMAAATALIRVLGDAGRPIRAGYTAANRAGIEYARRVVGPGVPVALAPWDVPRWVDRALAVWRPAMLLLVETEIWPQWVAAAARRGVPVFVVSARVYPRDLRRYRLIRSFMGATLRRITGFLVQDEAERERFVRIGAPPQSCVVAGNLKHLVGVGEEVPRSAAARDRFGVGADEPVVVCGSVHRDEIGIVFDAMARVPLPHVRWIVAPRHRAVTAKLEGLAQRRGLAVARRSGGTAGAAWRLLVLDTIGELATAYSAATVAVIGGGFAPHGGHNPIEALRAGAAVVFGPHFDHFRAEGIALSMATPEARVSDAVSLAGIVTAWLQDPARRAAALVSQRKAMPDPVRIAATYRDHLRPWLAE